MFDVIVLVEWIGDETTKVFKVFAKYKYVILRNLDWLGLLQIVIKSVLTCSFVLFAFFFWFENKWKVLESGAVWVIDGCGLEKPGDGKKTASVLDAFF